MTIVEQLPHLLVCIATLLVAVPVTHWFAHQLQRLILVLSGSPAVALYGFHLLVLPGTLLHELSHLLAAWLLRVPTGRISLWPKRVTGGMVQLGTVEVGQSDVLRASLIGVAPLLAGTAVLLAIWRWPLGVWPIRPSVDEITMVLPRVWSARNPVLWLYLMLAVGNAMLPSRADRRAWGALAWYAGIGFGLLFLSGLPYLSNLPPRAADSAIDWVASSISAVTLVIALTIGADVALGLACRVASSGVARITGRKLVSA